MSRPAIAIFSKQNLLHNIEILKKRVYPSKIIAMIKANAYGHGLREVGAILQNEVDILGVCSIDEAIMLKAANINSNIMLTQGIYDANELVLASRNKFQVVFNNNEQLNWLEKVDLLYPLQSWIKINTGLGRLGFQIDEAKAAYERLVKNNHISKKVRIMSHFACADNASHPLNKKQIANFQEFIKGTDTEYSLCNSAGIINFPEHFYDFVRPGIAIYGISPIDGLIGADIGLKPVMTMKSKLMSVQKIKKGETIGYGARTKLNEDTYIGIVAFGYADGYPQTAADGTPILVNNKECNLIGKVSMDMLAVDLKNCAEASVGDEVILWGEGLPIERVSAKSASIVWNILTGIQSRVNYVWT